MRKSQYKKILWFIIKFLFINRNRLSDNLCIQNYSPNKTKKVVFGNDDVIVQIKICE